jgi:hypothetical protein
VRIVPNDNVWKSVILNETTGVVKSRRRLGPGLGLADDRTRLENLIRPRPDGAETSGLLAPFQPI